MRSQQSSKSQRSAWDATMKDEIGVTIPGSSKAPKQRTTRAMRDRATLKKQNVHGGVADLEHKRLARLERLELTNAWDPVEKMFDASEDHRGDDSSGDEHATSAKRRKSEKKSNQGKKQVFLAEVLLNDPNNDFVKAQARPSTRPPERVCDVTGKAARYTDPVTGLHVHDRKALNLLREQVPAWVKATAIAPYWEAVRTIQGGTS